MKTETLSVAVPYLIEQNYQVYTDEQHAVWAELLAGYCLNWKSTHRARTLTDSRLLASTRPAAASRINQRTS